MLNVHASLEMTRRFGRFSTALTTAAACMYFDAESAKASTVLYVDYLTADDSPKRILLATTFLFG